MTAWLLGFLLSAGLTTQTPNVQFPDESPGTSGIIRTLVSVFDQADVVALGENHESKGDSDVRIALVRDPGFAKKVRSIIVEFGSSTEQSTLDRYIRGENVPRPQLEKVWTTTSLGSDAWTTPIYPAFFAAVRNVNLKLPAHARIRVFAGDPGSHTDTNRDDAAVSILKNVLQNHGKALILYGAAHFFRTEGDVSDIMSDGGGIVMRLEAADPGRTFVVLPVGGPATHPANRPDIADYAKVDRALKTAVRPVLVSLKRPPYRDFTAEEFIGRRLLTGRKGPGFVSVFKGSTLTLGQMADACIYYGHGD